MGPFLTKKKLDLVRFSKREQKIQDQSGKRMAKGLRDTVDLPKGSSLEEIKDE